MITEHTDIVVSDGHPAYIGSSGFVTEDLPEEDDFDYSVRLSHKDYDLKFQEYELSAL